MKNGRMVGVALVYSVVTCPAPWAAGAAEDLATPLAQKGKIIFSDDFARADPGEWKSIIPAFTVADGVLIARQDRTDHGAVGRVHRPMKDVIIEFKFKLQGSTRFNAVFDDQGYKGSHAGHICRVSFSPKEIRLGDDKEGVMRNDIFAMRRDPARKADADALLQGRDAAGPAVIRQDAWHHVLIELAGDRMRVCLDGVPVARLQSPGLAHETKTSFHFTVNGPGVHFDDVRIWAAR